MSPFLTIPLYYWFQSSYLYPFFSINNNPYEKKDFPPLPPLDMQGFAVFTPVMHSAIDRICMLGNLQGSA